MNAEVNGDAQAAPRLEVWRTDTLMALAAEHGVDLVALVPELMARKHGKMPLGDSAYWIEFWTIDAGGETDGLYLQHAVNGD